MPWTRGPHLCCAAASRLRVWAYRAPYLKHLAECRGGLHLTSMRKIPHEAPRSARVWPSVLLAAVAVLLAGCAEYPPSAPYGFYPDERYYGPYYPGFGYICCFDERFHHHHDYDHDHDDDHGHGGGGGPSSGGGGTYVSPSVGRGGLGSVPHGSPGAGGPGTTRGPGTRGGGIYVQPGGRR